MEIGMLNFWSVINCLCNGVWNSFEGLTVYSTYCDIGCVPEEQKWRPLDKAEAFALKA